MSSAARVRELALSLVGQKYKLGNEPWYDVGYEPSSDPLASDCSGLVYSVFRKAGVLVGGRPLPRETAHDYYRRATRIPQPEKVGDLGFLVRKGHAYHVFIFVGADTVVEAGDGTGHVGRRTVAHENARGAVWGRLDTDIEEDDMTPDDVRKIVREELDIIWAPQEITAAQNELVRARILSAPRKDASKGASVGLVMLIAARLAKLMTSR